MFPSSCWYLNYTYNFSARDKPNMKVKLAPGDYNATYLKSLML